MRYIADTDGYVKEVSFGADITCDGQDCTEYTGAVPTGYTTLAEWFIEESDKLYRWQIVDGELFLDETAATPTEKSLLARVQELEALVNSIGDYIVKTGVDDIWTWEKWSNGKAKCYGVQEVRTAFSSTTAYTSHSGAIGGAPLPIGLFIEEPTVTATTHGETHSYYSGTTGASAEKLPNFYLMRSASATSTVYTIKVCYEVTGKWR